MTDFILVALVVFFGTIITRVYLDKIAADAFKRGLNKGAEKHTQDLQRVVEKCKNDMQAAKDKCCYTCQENFEYEQCTID